MESHGWRLFAHPLFREQLERLTRRVQKLARRRSSGIQCASRLQIAGDRSPPRFWMRFHETRTVRDFDRAICSVRIIVTGSGPGFTGRYRLFYRFSTKHRVIVYAWVNDEGSLRKSGSKTDLYVVFRAMLVSGDPHGSFAELMQ